MQLFGIIDLAARQRTSHTPVDDHGDAVAELDQFDEIGRDDQDPAAVADGIPDHGIDFLACAHVDADRRFIQEQHARPRIIPFSEHDLLLVAAGERPDQAERARRFHRKPGDRGFRTPGGGALLHPAPAREMAR